MTRRQKSHNTTTGDHWHDPRKHLKKAMPSRRAGRQQTNGTQELEACGRLRNTYIDFKILV
jgi:hypothetical protein